MADIQYYGTGRRKTSTARVYLRPGAGNFLVNRKAFEAYFPNETHRMIIRQPFNLKARVGAGRREHMRARLFPAVVPHSAVTQPLINIRWSAGYSDPSSTCSTSSEVR